MNLKENYERFFGKMSQTSQPTKSTTLTEDQKQKWLTLSNTLGRKYPNVPLTIREGFVYVGNKKFEDVVTFLSKSSLTIQEQVRSLSLKKQ
jgi:hypothetical protein